VDTYPLLVLLPGRILHAALALALPYRRSAADLFRLDMPHIRDVYGRSRCCLRESSTILWRGETLPLPRIIALAATGHFEMAISVRDAGRIS